MNFNMNLVLYSVLVVVIYLIDVHSSLFYDGSNGHEWSKRQNSIMSNEVSDGQSGAEVRGDEVVGTRTGPKKGYKHEEKIVIEECCPTFREWIAPRGGVSRDGKILELFRNDNVSQRFLQISCRSDRRNRPCAFLDDHPTYGSYSRCVQQYTYTYAIVRAYDSDPDAPYKVDHIRMRSGCKCVVSQQFGNYDLAHRKPSIRFRLQQGGSGGGGGGRGGISRKPSGVGRRTMSMEDLVKGQLDIISHPSSPISASYAQHPVPIEEVEGDHATSYNVGEGEGAILARH